jgi:7-cyano-7-deazaguanine reductase
MSETLISYAIAPSAAVDGKDIKGFIGGPFKTFKEALGFHGDKEGDYLVRIEVTSSFINYCLISVWREGRWSDFPKMSGDNMEDSKTKFLGKTTKGPSEDLDTFANPCSQNDGVLHIWTDEFTCHCPVTGQPDFAHFHLWYIPDQICVELKALKLYLWTFRDRGAFHEKVTGEILEKLVSVLNPRFMHLVMKFGVRGGLYTNVSRTYRSKEWVPSIPLTVEVSDDGVKTFVTV